MGTGDFSPSFQAVVCLLKYYKRCLGNRCHGQEGGKRLLVSKFNLLLTKQKWLEHFGGESTFWGFFNPEVAVGYLSRNVLVAGLGGKTFLAWGCFVFLLCAITPGIKGKTTPSCGRLGSQPPNSHIDLDFISRP